MALFSARNLLTLTLPAFAKKKKRRKEKFPSTERHFFFLEDTFKSIAGLVELTKFKNEEL